MSKGKLIATYFKVLTKDELEIEELIESQSLMYWSEKMRRKLRRMQASYLKRTGQNRK
jgi:hypothetical protein